MQGAYQLPSSKKENFQLNKIWKPAAKEYKLLSQLG